MNPERESSRTALGVAALRAFHQLWDEEPKLLDDPVSIELLDPDVRERMTDIPASTGNTQMTKLRTHVLLRSRFAEDRLRLAVERDVAQCVILGAGLDTFAFRQPDWAKRLTIFEVDHPASQRFKRKRLADAGIEIPSNVVFVPLDFETTSLADGLAGSSFDRSEPAFFSWLGVMVYLYDTAISAIFRYIAECASGSEIVFSFATPQQRGPGTVGARAAALGEPWRTFYEPQTLEEKLIKLGYGHIEFLTPERAAQRYALDSRTDGLSRPVRTTIGTALVLD
jgi:methyltransferase (TIGR00027 family)